MGGILGVRIPITLWRTTLNFTLSVGGGGGVRPPLRKKLFPVSRVGKKEASREVWNFFFFFPNLIFYELECTVGGGGAKKKKKKV